MIFFVFIFYSLAQQELYSPQKYFKQTQLCGFERVVSSSQKPATDDLITTKLLMQTAKNYPLSTEWIQQEPFLDKLGEVLYKNEANCQTQHLTHWGKNEEFPSLGLPHAIWYNQNASKKYQEQFPELIRYIKKNLKAHEKVQLSWPSLLLANPLKPAPWNSRETFKQIQEISLLIEATLDSSQLVNIKNKHPQHYDSAYQLFEIRHFLSNPIVLRLQAKYVVEKTFFSLHRILAVNQIQSPLTTQTLYSQIQRLLASQEGVLSLVDYLNFKGEGLRNSELTPVNHYPWGLKTVLELMPQIKHKIESCTAKIKNDPHCANNQFAEAALCSLQRLAYHSGIPDSAEQTQRYLWLNGGWKTRVETNYRPGTFAASRCTKEQKNSPVSTTKSESL